MSFVTFGEIMLRLTPDVRGSKIKSAGAFEVGFAGSEANVACTLGMLKNNVCFVSKLPDNQLGDAAVASLQAAGIRTDTVIRGGKRIGTYYIEAGQSIRPSAVIYDRAHSALSEIGPQEFNWPKILEGQQWLFISGITPVLSPQCAAETIQAARMAQQQNVRVAFDMNFRRSLWKSAEEARQVFDQILPYTNLLFGNTGVLQDVYDMKIAGHDVADRTANAIQAAAQKFGVPQLAFTIRTHASASDNTLSGIFFSDGQMLHANHTYPLAVIDRFGTGDAFAGACLHAMAQGWSHQDVIDFATAAFALKHTIPGDRHTSSEPEIRAIMEGHISGHVIR